VDLLKNYVSIVFFYFLALPIIIFCRNLDFTEDFYFYFKNLLTCDFSPSNQIQNQKKRGKALNIFYSLRIIVLFISVLKKTPSPNIGAESKSKLFLNITGRKTYDKWKKIIGFFYIGTQYVLRWCSYTSIRMEYFLSAQHGNNLPINTLLRVCSVIP